MPFHQHRTVAYHLDTELCRRIVFRLVFHAFFADSRLLKFSIPWGLLGVRTRLMGM